MDTAFIQDRITATKNMIVLYETAINAIVTGGVETYTLDTGQTIQKVTKLDVPAMQRTLDSLYNRCATLEARLRGGGATGIPVW